MQDLGADARGNKSEPVTPVSQGPGPYFCPQTMSSKTGEVEEMNLLFTPARSLPSERPSSPSRYL